MPATALILFLSTTRSASNVGVLGKPLNAGSISRSGNNDDCNSSDRTHFSTYRSGTCSLELVEQVVDFTLYAFVPLKS
jgi:hypothetical protein